MKRLRALVIGVVLVACAKEGSHVTRNWVANVMFSNEAGAFVSQCLDGRYGYEELDNCIQRVRLPSGEERVELAAVACPAEGTLVPSENVVVSLVLRQGGQLFDTKGRFTDSVGELAGDGKLRNLCTGHTHSRVCFPNLASGRWQELTTPGAPCP